MGRVSVDLYPEQSGATLAEVRTLRQVARRQSYQRGRGRRPAGPVRRRHHPGGRRRVRPLRAECAPRLRGGRPVRRHRSRRCAHRSSSASCIRPIASPSCSIASPPRPTSTFGSSCSISTPSGGRASSGPRAPASPTSPAEPPPSARWRRAAEAASPSTISTIGPRSGRGRRPPATTSAARSSMRRWRSGISRRLRWRWETVRPEVLARRLLKLGPELAIVKLGERRRCGRLGRSRPHGWNRCRVEVVNGLGAGDAFGGAVCHGLLAGWEPVRVVAFRCCRRRIRRRSARLRRRDADRSGGAALLEASPPMRAVIDDRRFLDLLDTRARYPERIEQAPPPNARAARCWPTTAGPASSPPTIRLGPR